MALAAGLVLRSLAGAGVFAEVTPKTFGLTPLAELLRSDAPGSMRNGRQASFK